MMQNRKTLGLLLGAILLGALWVGLDVAVDPDPVSIAELILDTIEKALMIIGAGGVALMLRSVKAHQRDNLALMR